jgi:bifunctional pyridoxal-dependent enzyme with beta-cystathionase and maltose regulon repressor activities
MTSIGYILAIISVVAGLMAVIYMLQTPQKEISLGDPNYVEFHAPINKEIPKIDHGANHADGYNDGLRVNGFKVKGL